MCNIWVQRKGFEEIMSITRTKIRKQEGFFCFVKVNVCEIVNQEVRSEVKNKSKNLKQHQETGR